MKNIWPKRVYIDLFAGPGYNKIRPTGDIAESGPLIAAAQRTPFTFCFFVDLSLDSCNALNSRFGKISAGRPFEVINGDCNSPQIINRITNVLDRCTLSVCIIDPTTVNVRFATIEQLTNGYRMDLLITFPFGMSINRHIDKWVEEENSPLDEFFGSREWRGIYERVRLSSSTGYKRKVFTDYYCNRLKTIGYKFFDARVQVRSSTKSTHLYSLVFASKHPKGLEFYIKDSKYVGTGQGELFS